MEQAQQADTTAVHLDHGYNRATGEKIKPNRRPDVTVVKENGTVNAYEVRSKTDKKEILQQRNEEAMAQLPETRRGEIIIKPSNKNLK